MDNVPTTDLPDCFREVIRIDEGQIKGHVDELLRTSVEQNLNALLDANGHSRSTLPLVLTAGLHPRYRIGEGRKHLGSRETFGRLQWNGQETVPQRGRNGQETVPQRGTIPLALPDR